jgi:hypothetical protein
MQKKSFLSSALIDLEWAGVYNRAAVRLSADMGCPICLPFRESSWRLRRNEFDYRNVPRGLTLILIVTRVNRDQLWPNFLLLIRREHSSAVG